MPNNGKKQKSKFMFPERIKGLSTLNQMSKRRLAAASDVGATTYYETEKGEKKNKKRTKMDYNSYI